MAVHQRIVHSSGLFFEKTGVLIKTHLSSGALVSNGKKKCNDRCSSYIPQTSAWRTCMTENGCALDPA